MKRLKCTKTFLGVGIIAGNIGEALYEKRRVSKCFESFSENEQINNENNILDGRHDVSLNLLKIVSEIR